MEKELTLSWGVRIVNPVRLLQLKYNNPESMEWDSLMMSCLDWLRFCTHIYLMSGWEKSYGARIEQLWGEKLGLIEIREGKSL